MGPHTHPFNGPFSGTTRVGRYQKGKTNLDFTEARDSEWQWYQLGHMQVCTSLITDNHASTSPLSFFTGRMPCLPPNQQFQSTEGTEWDQTNDIHLRRVIHLSGIYLVRFDCTAQVQLTEHGSTLLALSPSSSSSNSLSISLFT